MKNRVLFFGDSYLIEKLDDSKKLFGNLDSYGIRINENPVDLGKISKFDSDLFKVYEECTKNAEDFENYTKNFKFLNKSDILQICSEIGYCSDVSIQKWFSEKFNIDETLITFENAKDIFDGKIKLEILPLKEWKQKECQYFNYIENIHAEIPEYYLTDENFNIVGPLILSETEFKVELNYFYFKNGKLIKAIKN